MGCFWKHNSWGFIGKGKFTIDEENSKRIEGREEEA